VRIAHLDESGTGKPEREPFVVIASVVIDGDKQWKSLSQYLSDMAEEVVPKSKKSQFVAFHAKELYSGGKIFERAEGKPGSWWPILDELVSIPQKFDLPVIFGYVPRRWFLPGGKQHHPKSGIPGLVMAQMMAFAACSVGIEHWMKHVASNEVVQMIMENNNETRAHIKQTQRLITDPKYRAMISPQSQEFFNISRIMWPINFQEKTDSSILQIADACAWAIRRRLSRERNSERFYQPMRSQFVNELSSTLEGDAPPRIMVSDDEADDGGVEFVVGGRPS
jgi:hypothetical protein